MRALKLHKPNPSIPEVIEQNRWQKFVYIPSRTKWMTVVAAHDLWMINSGIPKESYNIICNTHLDSENASTRIHYALGHFQQLKLPVSWWVGPTSMPKNLEHQLILSGCQKTEHEIGMALDLRDFSSYQDLFPTDIYIRPIGSIADLRKMIHMLSLHDSSIRLLYTEPLDWINSPYVYFIGLVDTQVITTVSLFCQDGVAGIFDLFTSPEYRNLGYGSAIVRRALAYAKQVGYTLATLSASQDGVNVYRRFGFEEYCTFNRYVFQDR